MKTNHTMQITGILLLGVMLLSACTYSYSQAPAGTATAIPTNLFVSPFPSGQDPLKVIADLGTQTAAAATAAAGGATVAVVGTPGTPSTEAAGTDTPSVSTDETEVATLLPVTVIPGGATFTPTTESGTVTVPTVSGTISVPTTSGTVAPLPASYTLQKGEFPYCIARRYNVNPNELLNLNNLTIAESTMLNPGLVLSMPQTGDPFPGDRALNAHPATYTVPSSDTTIYGVACNYGDITPQAIATANNITLSSILTAGQKLTIP